MQYRLIGALLFVLSTLPGAAAVASDCDAILESWQPEVLHSIEELKNTKSRVVLIPDAHTEVFYYKDFLRLVKTLKPAWIMLEWPRDDQAAIDAYMGLGSPNALSEASRLAEIARVWKDRYDRDLFSLLDLCRKQGTRVIFGDITWKEAELTERERMKREFITRRNQMWALVLPPSGKGLVFGGAVHFFSFLGHRVQDYIRQTEAEEAIAIYEANSRKDFHMLLRLGLFYDDGIRLTDHEREEVTRGLTSLIELPDIDRVKFYLAWTTFFNINLQASAANRQVFEASLLKFAQHPQNDAHSRRANIGIAGIYYRKFKNPNWRLLDELKRLTETSKGYNAEIAATIDMALKELRDSLSR